jgi:hypothetical protein
MSTDTSQLRKLGILPGTRWRVDGALARGLVDTEVAMLDVDWSALKLVWRREARVRG